MQRRYYIKAGIFYLSVVASFFVCLSQVPLTSQDQKKIIEGQVKILTSETASYETRKISAGLLLDINIPEAQDELLRLIRDSKIVDIRLAIIDAISERPAKLAQFIPALFEIIMSDETDPKVKEAAAACVARSRDKAIVEELFRIVSSKEASNRTKLLAVRTLGRIRTKEAVSALINLLKLHKKKALSEELTSAVIDALSELTAKDYGENIDSWINWWSKYEDKSPTRWFEDQIEYLLEQTRSLEKKVDDLETAFIDFVVKIYKVIPQGDPKGKEILKELLGSDLVASKVAALDVLLDTSAKVGLEEDIVQIIKGLLKDKDPVVRQKAARLCGNADLRLLLPDIIDQLKIEQNPKVKAELILAIGRLGNEDNIRFLMEWISSPEEQIATAAIKAVGEIAEGGIANEDIRAKLVDALLERYRTLASDKVVLRQELIHTMSIIADKRFVSVFKEAINSDVAAIRLDSVKGLSSIGGGDVVEFLINYINDPDPGLRAKIISSIADLSSDEKIADMLASRLNPSVEKDSPVRKIIWNSILLMIKRWPLEKKIGWAKRHIEDEYISQERWAELLDILSSQLVSEAQNLSSQGRYNVYMDMGDIVISKGSRQDAIRYYKEAILARVQFSGGDSYKSAADVIAKMAEKDVPVDLALQFVIALPDIIGEGQYKRFIEFVKSDDFAFREYADRVLLKLSQDKRPSSEKAKEDIEVKRRASRPTTQPSAER